MTNQVYTLKTIRAATILTTSYVASTVIGQDNLESQDRNQLLLYIDFTIGSLTSLQIKAEFSDDNVNFYQETFLSITGGVATGSLGEYEITATGKYRLAIPIKDKYIKISAKGTGTVTSSSLEIKSIIATA